MFNHEVYLDISLIDSEPHKLVLHVVDRGTHFSAVAYESTAAVWNTFVSCWVFLILMPTIKDQFSHVTFSRTLVQNFESLARLFLLNHTTPLVQVNNTTPLRKIYKNIKL